MPDYREYKGRNEFYHSAKGTTWKKHKYIAIKNGRYIYSKTTNLANKLGWSAKDARNLSRLRGADAARAYKQNKKSEQSKYSSDKIGEKTVPSKEEYEKRVQQGAVIEEALSKMDISLSLAANARIPKVMSRTQRRVYEKLFKTKAKSERNYRIINNQRR